jgi:hypothetical protein
VSSSKEGVKGLKKKGRGTGIKVWEKAVREMPPKMEIATSSRLVGAPRNDNGGRKGEETRSFAALRMTIVERG